MNMSQLFEAALHIEQPWFISSVNFSAEQKKLEIKIDFTKGTTFKLPGIDGAHKAYDTVEKSWRHLNFFEHECYLIARIPRVKTPDGKLHTIDPSWSGFLNGFTLLFEAMILQLATSMPVHELSRIINVSDYKIWAILDKYVEKARELENDTDVSKIGMDETSIAKGHSYITMVVDLNTRRTIFVTEGKDASTVTKFKEDFILHSGDVDKITDVSCDMSPAFIKGIHDY